MPRCVSQTIIFCVNTAGALSVIGGAEWRLRIGQRVNSGTPPRSAIITEMSTRAKVTLVFDDATTTRVNILIRTGRQHFFVKDCIIIFFEGINCFPGLKSHAPLLQLSLCKKL